MISDWKTLEATATLDASDDPALRARARLDTAAGVLRRHWALAIVLAVVAFVYLPTLDDYFHGDDFIAFVDLASKSPLPYMRDVLTFQDSNIYWRPLGEVYHLAMYHAFGLSPAAFHGGSLFFFLATLTLLYAFCLSFGLNRPAAVGAVLFLGLFPNHPVNVAWTTAVPRVIGVMFLIGALLLVMQATKARGLRWDVAAVLVFALACLSDETLAVLAPVPVLLALLFDRRRGWRARMLTRSVVFGALAATVIALQVLVAPAEAPGSHEYGLGTHVFRNYWALASRLVLPTSDGITLAEVQSAQWAAGAAAAVGALWLAVMGSWRVRFLVFWALVGLAPFSLWIEPIAPARYVYVAAVPFAVLCAWLLVGAGEALWGLGFRRFASSQRVVPYLIAAPAAVLIFALAFVAASETRARNAAFAAETEQYRILAQELPKVLPTLPEGATVVVYYGVWDSLVVWPTSVIRTVYKDPTLKFVNVPSERVNTFSPFLRTNDRAVFFTGSNFLAPEMPAVAGSGR